MATNIPPRRYISAETALLLRPKLDLSKLPQRRDADGVTRYDVLGFPDADEPLPERSKGEITVISQDEVEVGGTHYFSRPYTAAETGYSETYLQNLSFSNKLRVILVPRKLTDGGKGRSQKFYDLDSVRAYRAAHPQYQNKED